MEKLPNLLVDEQFRKCVAFLTADIPDLKTGVVVRTPAASGFLVGVPLGEGVDAWAVYVVTARHVIDTSRPYGPLYVRLNRRDRTGFDDFATPQDNWTCHPQTDVAVAPLGLRFREYDILWIGIEDLATDEYVADNRIGAGDDVFFVGLFTEHPGRARSEPIIRFGNVSLMPHEPIPIKMGPEDDAPTLRVDAYLVEARSWGGHSGSPAFIYYTLARETPRGEGGPGKVLTLTGPGLRPPALLGLVHGHYEIEQDIAFVGDILGSGKVPINAGIAVVIPAQRIIDTLMDEELVEFRRSLHEDVVKQSPKPKPDGGPS